MIIYQLALTVGNWQYFIEDAPRTSMEDLIQWNSQNENCLAEILIRIDNYMSTNFFLANREGILGCLGYLFVYYMGEYIGYHYLIQPQPQPSSSSSSSSSLGVVSLVLWIIHYILVHGLNIEVSRRSTNLGFCTWSLAHNVLLLCLIQQMTFLFDEPTTTTKTPPQNDNGTTTTTTTTTSRRIVVWEIVNKHGLIMFLIANLLTGLVNLTIPTLETPPLVALGVVFGYIISIGFIAIIIDTLFARRNIISNKTDQNKIETIDDPKKDR
jgi:phosphatidylinositol glycan class W